MLFPIRQWLFDTEAFDDKHQHVLMPSSLFTGIAHTIVKHAHEHSLKYTKKPENDQTTTVGPKITDFIAKIKKRSTTSDEADFFSLEDTNCGCSGKMSIADGIAEHLAENRNKEVKSTTNLELEEDASFKSKSAKLNKHETKPKRLN